MAKDPHKVMHGWLLGTELQGTDIVQEVASQSGFADTRERLWQQLIRTADKQVQEKLVELGWTPPVRAPLNLAERVDTAVKSVWDGHGAAPRPQQFTEALQPLIEEILRLPVAEIVNLFRRGIRAGTFDVEVLNEVKAVLRWAGDDLARLR